MTDFRWWQTGVIYQVYPRSFQDASGDGVGDLRGITQRLSYLAETLGVDALWISPFYPSPMADFGYDVVDYVGVDPLFGDLTDFDALVVEAHRLGLKIIIDWVPNHTSDQHPWFRASRSSRDHPQRDWYLWRDARPDGSPPNNWLAKFGGSAWTWEATTAQYYLHSYLPQQPDLNWRHPDVRTAMFETLRFWLERGVDGFRIDVAHLILKDPDLRDNPANPTPGSQSHKPLGAYDTQLHLYDNAHPDTHGVYRDLRRLLDAYEARDGRARVAIGEIRLFDLPLWASYYGANLDELHLPFNFGLLHAPWTARDIRAAVDRLEAVLPPGAWPNYVLGNHDEARIATRFGPAQARVAAMLLLTLRGTPTLYYGDELGLRDVPIPPERERDPFGLRVPGLRLGRDPERTPMQWDASPHAGFCPPDVEPWLPLAEDCVTVNVAVQLEAPTSPLSLTRRLLRLRRGSQALRSGGSRPLDGFPDGCFVFLREGEAERFLVALNMTGEAQTLRLADDAVTAGRAAVVLSTWLDREGQVVSDAASAFVLRPDEGCILALS